MSKSTRVYQKALLTLKRLKQDLFNQSTNLQTNFYQPQQDFYQTQQNNFVQEQKRRNSALKAFSSINGFSSTPHLRNNECYELRWFKIQTKFQTQRSRPFCRAGSFREWGTIQLASQCIRFYGFQLFHSW